MRLSNRNKVILFSCVIILNCILRLQVVSREIGYDSIEMHVMTNSLSEFGYARWFLDPLSIVGMYPASYTSAMHFLLSGISQTTNMEMNSVIFIYCIFLGILSFFISYIMAGIFIDDDVFKFLTGFCFSTLPGVLSYSTWTIPTRGLFVILAPIAVYLMLKLIMKFSIRNIFLLLFFSALLFATHHLFYFLIPVFISFFIVFIIFKTKFSYFLLIKEKIFNKFYNKRLSEHFTTLCILMGFSFMYAIPFVTKRFLETSRYDPIYIGYIRYIGLISIFAIGGLFYLIFKSNKNPKEWFIITSLMLLMVFIYKITYMKWFLPIIVVLFTSIGLFNLIKVLKVKDKPIYIISIILILSVSISGYYQFLHGEEGGIIKDSTFSTGKWIKNYISGNCISNSEMGGRRVCSISETHFFDTSTRIVQTYGFININISDYERYPITSDDFWLSGYKGRDTGSDMWHSFHKGWTPLDNYNISYIVEYTPAGGKIRWTHKGEISVPIQEAYNEKYCVYDAGNIRIWS